MATKSGAAQVTLNGRFRAGSTVRLVKVKDESVLRPGEGDEVVGEKAVDEHGRVQFTKGVEAGARYFIVGQVDGQPLEVRVRGNAAEDDNSLLTNPPIQAERQKLADGSFADERPEREKTPGMEVAPGPGLHQVPEGTVLRSDTPRGSAHPVDPAEPLPAPRQEDAEGLQRSDTATGQAAPVTTGDQSQRDVNGPLQRSDTPEGQATPIPAGDAVKVQQRKESSEAKAAHGEPGKAAATPEAEAKPAPKKKRSAPRRRAGQSRTKTSGGSSAKSNTTAPKRAEKRSK